MPKIAALGRRHFAGALAALGAATTSCETPEAFDEAAEALGEAEAPALILVDQHFADQHGTLEALRAKGSIVILLAAEPAEGHPALDEMRDLIEAAAGANILGEY